MIHAPEIEAAVLGKSLESQQTCSIVLSTLESPDFTDYRQVMFEAIGNLFTQDAPVNPAALRNYLQEHDLAIAVGGLGMVDNLLEKSSGVKEQGVDVACRYLKRYTKARKFRKLLEQYYDESKNYGAESDQLFAKAGSDLFDLLADKDDDKESDVSEVIDEEVALYREPIQGGILTGLDLDKITNGFRPGNFVVIAGKTSHGKSALVDDMILRVSGEHASALASMEMTRSEIIERFVANESNVNYGKIRNRTLSEQDWGDIERAKEQLRQKNITIIDKGSLDINHLYATARRLKLQKDISLFVVDYLQQVSSEGETREREVAKVTRMLKSIAQDLGIVVVGLSQFNRKAGDHDRPQMNQMRESGAIEHDANTVIILWNPSVDGKDRFPDTDPEKWAGKSTHGIVELNVAKNRGGKTGSVKVRFDAEHQRFENLAPEPKTAMDYLK